MPSRERVLCELCGSNRETPLFTGEDWACQRDGNTFTIVQCLDCGLRYVDPRPTEAEIGRFYPPQYFAEETHKPRSALELRLKRGSNAVKRWIREDFYGYPGSSLPRWVRILRRLVLWPEKTRRVFRGREILTWIGGGRLLDVGCGRGVNLQSFQGEGWDVYGIEMSESAATKARGRVGDRVHCGTLETAPFKPESFDAVVFSHSLEHHFKPLRALLQARQLLKPDGRLVVTVPNSSGWEAKLFGHHWIGWDLPRHLFHFDRTTLLALLGKAGFVPVRILTGADSAFFAASLNRLSNIKLGRSLPASRLIEKLFVRPITLISGHLGHGTEITVYAEKDSRKDGRGVSRC